MYLVSFNSSSSRLDMEVILMYISYLVYTLIYIHTLLYIICIYTVVLYCIDGQNSIVLDKLIYDCMPNAYSSDREGVIYGLRLLKTVCLFDKPLGGSMGFTVVFTVLLPGKCTFSTRCS